MPMLRWHLSVGFHYLRVALIHVVGCVACGAHVPPQLPTTEERENRRDQSQSKRTEISTTPNLTSTTTRIRPTNELLVAMSCTHTRRRASNRPAAVPLRLSRLTRNLGLSMYSEQMPDGGNNQKFRKGQSQPRERSRGRRCLLYTQAAR